MTTRRSRAASAAGAAGTVREQPQVEGHRAESVTQGEHADSAVVVQPVSATSATPAPVAIPLTSRAVFWRPRHPHSARSLQHQPFLFWLVETLRPARIVQLGLDDPAGYLALCQAVDKIGLEAVCMAVEPDPDRPALSGEDADLHSRFYGDFSFALSGDLAHAARQTRGGEIDLLVVDTPLTSEAVAALHTHWLPRLSERAVLVIHDPATRLADPAARHFVDELQRACPGICFPEARPGLDVVLIGARQSDRLLRLAELETAASGHLAAHQVFARLGQGLEGERQALQQRRALEKAETVRQDLEARILRAEAALAQEREHKEAALEAENRQVAQLAELQAHLFDLRQAQQRALKEQDRTAEIAELQEQLQEAISQRDTHWRKVEALTAEKVALSATLTEARARLEERTKELVACRTTAKEAGNRESEQQKKTTALAGEKSQLEIRLADLTKENKVLQQSLKEATDKKSSNWRKAEALSAEKASLQAELATLQAACDKMAAEAGGLKEALSAQGDRSAGTEAELAALRAELAQRETVVAALESERDTLRASSASEIEALAQKLADSESREGILAGAEARLEAEMAGLRSAADEANVRLAAQNGEIARLHDQLRQSRERRLAIWESQESLRAAHEALLARIGSPESAPADVHDPDSSEPLPSDVPAFAEPGALAEPGVPEMVADPVEAPPPERPSGEVQHSEDEASHHA